MIKREYTKIIDSMMFNYEQRILTSFNFIDYYSQDNERMSEIYDESLQVYTSHTNTNLIMHIKGYLDGYFSSSDIVFKLTGSKILREQAKEEYLKQNPFTFKYYSEEFNKTEDCFTLLHLILEKENDTKLFSHICKNMNRIIYEDFISSHDLRNKTITVSLGLENSFYEKIGWNFQEERKTNKYLFTMICLNNHFGNKSLISSYKNGTNTLSEYYQIKNLSNFSFTEDEKSKIFNNIYNVKYIASIEKEPRILNCLHICKSISYIPNKKEMDNFQSQILHFSNNNKECEDMLNTCNNFFSALKIEIQINNAIKPNKKNIDELNISVNLKL